MGWGARLLVGLVLILVGAGAAIWGLAHYQPAQGQIAHRKAGATWWLDARWQVPEGMDSKTVVEERLAAGPPRIAS